MRACPEPERSHGVPAGLIDSLRDSGGSPPVRSEEVERLRTPADRRTVDNEVAITIATRILELTLVG